MEAEFLGIVFRSENHMYWFWMSMSFAAIIGLISLCSATVAIWKRHVGSVGFSVAQALVVSGGVTYAIFGFVAGIRFVVAISTGRDPNGPTWSVDCIWFNFSMAASCLIIFAVVYLLRRNFSRGKVT